MRRVLTKRQAEVLAYLDRNPQPSVRAVAVFVGSRNACPQAGVNHIQALIRKGFLERPGPRMQCAYRIVRRIDGDRLLLGGRWHGPGDRLIYDGCEVVWCPEGAGVAG